LSAQFFASYFLFKMYPIASSDPIASAVTDLASGF